MATSVKKDEKFVLVYSSVMITKISHIFFETIPVLLMIALIPFVQNDYTLTILYILIITTALVLKRKRNDFLFFVFGFFLMMLSEYLFISTGVETFIRNSLFGLMPLWLPFLWAYGFVVIKRAIVILGV